MAMLVFGLGAVVASLLVGLLLATIARRSLHIWPTPGRGTWQHTSFWLLFRGLNILCVAVAALDRTPLLGLPPWARGTAALALAAAFGVFLFSFLKLGRDNSYGADNGLVTAGIYQWSRNPQNAALIVFYMALAVVSDNLPTTILCAAMATAYHLMVLAEEPWLADSYGEAYRAYCKTVPRYFNWMKLVAPATSKSRSGP